MNFAFCPACGWKNEEDRRTCPRCGRLLVDVANDTEDTLDARVLSERELAEEAVAMWMNAQRGESGVVQDMERWAERGYPMAQFCVGVCYAEGRGTERRPELALLWLNRAATGLLEAANAGDVEAQYAIGCCYAYDIEGLYDYDNAVKWLTKAADRGYKEGRERLERLQKRESERRAIEEKTQRLTAERDQLRTEASLLREEKNQLQEELRKAQAKAKRTLTKAERKAKRRERAHVAWRVMRYVLTYLLYCLPLGLVVAIGVDAFAPGYGNWYAMKVKEVFPFGWAVTLYVFFVIAAVSYSIAGIVAVSNNRSYKTGGPLRRKQKWGALVLAVCVVAILAGNLVFTVQDIGKTRIALRGGYEKQLLYPEEGDFYVLADAPVRDNIVHKQYYYRYDFEYYNVNGKRMQPGDMIRAEGWTDVRAVYSTHKMTTVTMTTSGAHITLTCNGETYESDQVEEVHLPFGSRVKVEITYTYNSTSSLTVNGKAREKALTKFTLNRKYTLNARSYEPGSGGGFGCLVEGTTMRLSDGTCKPIEQLKVGDVLCVFDHDKGEWSASPLLANVHALAPAQEYEVLWLTFDDGTRLGVVESHGLFDRTLGRYEYLSPDNAREHIGHVFASYGEDGAVRNVTLTDATTCRSVTRVYNPLSVWHVNTVANGLLTTSAHLVNLFEYTPDMAYDAEAKQRDIDTYGLIPYEQVADLVTWDEYNAFPVCYFAIPVGKGEYTLERLRAEIMLYLDEYTVR